MSDQNFPMPKTIGDLPAATSPRDYAPKRGLEAVAAEIERTPPRTAPYVPYTPPSTSPGGSQHTVTIKDAIKKLTHREMREMVAAIFAAQQKIMGNDELGEVITKGDLADVLDRFAYGE